MRPASPPRGCPCRCLLRSQRSPRRHVRRREVARRPFRAVQPTRSDCGTGSGSSVASEPSGRPTTRRRTTATAAIDAKPRVRRSASTASVHPGWTAEQQLLQWVCRPCLQIQPALSPPASPAGLGACLHAPRAVRAGMSRRRLLTLAGLLGSASPAHALLPRRARRWEPFGASLRACGPAVRRWQRSTWTRDSARETSSRPSASCGFGFLWQSDTTGATVPRLPTRCRN